jgi:heptosyltransferase-2
LRKPQANWVQNVQAVQAVQSLSLVLPGDAGEETGGGWNDWNFWNVWNELIRQSPSDRLRPKKVALKTNLRNAPVQWDNVLVLQTSFIGDTVLTLPLLSEIKRRYPRSRLSFLCTPQGSELAQNCAAVDEIIVDDKKGAHRGISGLWRQALSLRTKAFSLALTPHKSLRSALMLYLARIPCRVGFRQSKGWFLFNRLVQRAGDIHDVERNLSLLGAFGIANEECGRDYALSASPSRTSPLLGELAALKNGGKRLVVGVNPGSVWATKRWRPMGFAEVIKLIKVRWDCEVVIFGGPDDVALAAAIEEAARSNCLNYAGKFSLRDLPQALAACDLFISNDSAPMHIAVALGVPTVALFCATTPALGFYPYSGNAVVLQKDLPCRPCSSHGGRRCPLGTEDCIRLIRPEHVVQAVERLLEGRAQETAAMGHQPEFVFV